MEAKEKVKMNVTTTDIMFISKHRTIHESICSISTENRTTPTYGPVSAFLMFTIPACKFKRVQDYLGYDEASKCI